MQNGKACVGKACAAESPGLAVQVLHQSLRTLIRIDASLCSTPCFCLQPQNPSGCIMAARLADVEGRAGITIRRKQGARDAHLRALVFSFPLGVQCLFTETPAFLVSLYVLGVSSA